MAVKFRIDQNSRPQGVVDEARHDLVPLQLITLTAIEPPPGPGVTFQWEVIDRAGTNAGLSATTGDVVTITPPSGRPWGFCVELRAYLAGVLIGARRRIFSARSAKFNLRLPLFSETADPISKLAARNPEASTDNAVCNLGGSLESGQNWRGWAQMLHELVMAVEGLVYGVATVGTPSRTGSINGSMGSDQQAAPKDHVHPNPQLSMVPTPSDVGFAAVKTYGSELFALSDHVHAGAGFNVLPVSQNGGTFSYTIGEYFLGSSDVKQLFLDLNMTAGTSATVKVPVGDETYVPRGTRVWGAQAGDAVINFQALTNVQIEAPDGVTATTGKGCLFLLVKLGITGFNPVKWRLMIFPGAGGGAGGGGGEVTAEAVRTALASNAETVYFNSQRLSAVGVAQSDTDAVSRGYMLSYLGALPFNGSSDLSGYIVNSDVRVVRLRGHYISTTAPMDGQVLVWSGSNQQWQPTSLSGGGGSIPPAAGDLEGDWPDVEVKGIRGIGVTPWGEGFDPPAGMTLQIHYDGPYPSYRLGFNLLLNGAPIYGEVLAGQVLAYNGGGYWEPVTPSGGGTLAGDVTGASGSNSVVKLRGRDLSIASPTNGQALVWNNGLSEWRPTTITTPDLAVGGDASGTVSTITVVKLQGRPVASTAPTNGQVLGWDGSTWKPTTLSGGGGAVTLAGDVEGDAGANSVVKLRGTALNPFFTPFDGEYLMYDSLSGGWTPSPLVVLGYRITGSPPSNGQVLTFVQSEDESPSSWRATDPSGGGGGGDASSLQGNPVESWSPFTDAYLVWTGASWAPGNLSIMGYQVLGEAPMPGQVLTFVESEDESPSYWTPADPGGGGGGSGDAVSLQGYDVADESPMAGEVLTWDSEFDVWRPMAPSGGGGEITSIGGAPIVLEGLPPDGQHLVFRSDEGGDRWQPQVINAVELQGQQVADATPSDGDVLTWSEGDGFWIPTAPTSGGESGIVAAAYSGHGNVTIANTSTTWSDIHTAVPGGWVDDLTMNTSRSGSSITVTKAGVYLVNYSMAWYGSGTFCDMRVRVNGVTKLANSVFGGTIGSVNPSCFINGPLSLEAGDVVTFQYANAGSGSAGYSQTTPTDGETERWIAAVHLTRVSGSELSGEVEGISLSGDGRITGVADPVADSDADTKGARQAAIVTAVGWKKYCDFNFTQMPNRSIAADGDLLIDGVTMTAGNAVTGNSSMSIVNGTGLRIAATSSANTFWYHTAHSATWLGIDLSRIPGWILESSEARIFAEWYLTVGTANYATAGFGFTKRLNFSGNDWSPMMRQVYAGSISRSVHYVYAATEDYKDFNNAYNVGMAYYRGQYDLAFFAKTFSGVDTDLNSAAFDDVAAMTLVGRHTEARALGVGPRVGNADGAMAFLTGQNGNTSNNTVCTFKRLRIEYRL